MSSCKIVYAITILIIINFSIIVWSSNPAETKCNCCHVRECKHVSEVIQFHKDKSSLKPCALPYKDFYCCPSPLETTISERKCTEFSNLKALCNETGLIADGKKVEPHSIPFIASLQTRSKSDKNLSWNWICGGTLIDRKFILTAAHCVYEFNENTTEMTVVLGAHNKTEIYNSTRFNVKIITQHPNYNESKPLNDIAILEMERSADFSRFEIRPACLPASSREDLKEFVAAGFGAIDETTPSSELLKTTLMTHDIKKCGFTPYTKLNETLHFCAGPDYKTGKDVCDGDSGGPIFGIDPNHSNCLFAVMGVITKGNSCSNEGARTLHTRVSYYREWIEQIVWPNDRVRNNTKLNTCNQL